MFNAFLFSIAFALVAVLIPLLARAAPRFGLIDRPGGHKDHPHAVPVVGGIAMGFAFLACFVPIALMRELSYNNGGTFIGLTGL